MNIVLNLYRNYVASTNSTRQKIHVWSILTSLICITIITFIPDFVWNKFVTFVYSYGYFKSSLTHYFEVWNNLIHTIVKLSTLGLVTYIIAIFIFECVEKISIKNPLILCILTLLIVIFFANYILIKFPNSADEYAYLFQSITFSDGKLWNSTYPIQDIIDFVHIIANENKWVSRFPPGWPLLISFTSLLNIPNWLVNPILSAGVIYVFFSFAKNIHGEKVSAIATICLVSSSFFVFNGASYFSHMSTLLLLLLFYHHGVYYLETNRWKYAMLAGLWIGFAFITRPYTALLICVPLLIYSLIKSPTQALAGSIWIAIGATPFIVFLLYYNYAITGDPFLMVTQWVDKNEGLGFVKGHTLSRGLTYTIRHLQNLIFWTSPILLFLLIANAAFTIKSKNRPVKKYIFLEVSIFTSVVAGHAFYYTMGGNSYGPRFYFEAYPFLILAVTAMVFGAPTNTGNRIYFSKLFYIAGLLLAVILVPFHAIKENAVIVERTDLYTLVESLDIHNAFILIENGTGVKRPMQVGDLVRNGVSLRDKDIIYARDNGESTYGLISKQFPNRNIYRYIRPENEVHGRLTAVNHR